MEKEPVLPEELLDNIRTRLPVREIFQTSLVCKRWAQVCKSSHFCDQVCSNIPIVDVDGDILAKVIEYYKYHAEARTWSGDKAATAEDEIKAWDQEFMKVDQATVFGLLRAADYLNVRSLVDLTCQSVADMLKGKSVEELRHMLGITNDFTPEEEEEVRRENQWAFD